MSTLFSCPNCKSVLRVDLALASPEPVVRADYAVKYSGYDAKVITGKTDSEMTRHIGQEDLEYCYEIPGTRRKV